MLEVAPANHLVVVNLSSRSDGLSCNASAKNLWCFFASCRWSFFAHCKKCIGMWKFQWAFSCSYSFPYRKYSFTCASNNVVAYISLVSVSSNLLLIPLLRLEIQFFTSCFTSSKSWEIVVVFLCLYLVQGTCQKPQKSW